TIGGGVENNWDLSTKRATAIVNILPANAKIKKENLTAAGRGEFAPLMSNETAEGKAKNRRIEIILTPKLDEISKMLNDL
nr:OmpA family protein [Flavobacterium sp.]